MQSGSPSQITRYGSLQPVAASRANGYLCETGPRPIGRDGSTHDAPIHVGPGLPVDFPREITPIRLEPELKLVGQNLGSVVIEGYERVIIHRCVISDWETFGLKVRACRYVKITECLFAGPGDVETGHRGYGGLIEDCNDDVWIQGNTVKDCHIGFSLVRSKGVKVMDNVGDGNRWLVDAHVPNCDRAYIVGNEDPGAKIGLGSWAWSGRCQHSVVKNNLVSGYEIHGDASGTVIEHAKKDRRPVTVLVKAGFDGAVTKDLDVSGIVGSYRIQQA